MTCESYGRVGATACSCFQTFGIDRIMTGMNQGPPTIVVMK